MSWRSVINSVIDYLLGKKKWESPEAIFGSFSQYGSIRSSLWRIVKFMSPFKSSIFFMYGFSRPSKCGFGYVMWWRGGKSNVKAWKDGQSEALRTGKGSTRKETHFRHGISSESHPVLLAIFRTLYDYIQCTGIAYTGIYDTCIWEFRFG